MLTFSPISTVFSRIPKAGTNADTKAGTMNETLLHLKCSLSELFDLVPQLFSSEHNLGNVIFDITSLILDLMQELPPSTLTPLDSVKPNSTTRKDKSTTSTDKTTSKNNTKLINAPAYLRHTPPPYSSKSSAPAPYILAPQATIIFEKPQTQAPKTRPITFSSCRDYFNLKFYQYEVTFGVYMMQPAEKFLFNSIVISLLSALLYAIYLTVSLQLITGLVKEAENVLRLGKTGVVGDSDYTPTRVRLSPTTTNLVAGLEGSTLSLNGGKKVFNFKAWDGKHKSRMEM